MPLLPKFFLFGLNIYLCKGNICFILSLILSFFPNLLNMLPLFIWELGVSSTFMQRRQRHPTPVLLPGKSHGRRSLVGCSPGGSWRVGHGWATSFSLFTFMHWRMKWQPTPVFLPGESQGWGAWWAAIYGVIQSRTQLKRLSSSSSSSSSMVVLSQFFFFF